MTNILKNLQKKIRARIKLAIQGKKPSLDGEKDKDQLATDWYERGVEDNKKQGFKSLFNHSK